MAGLVGTIMPTADDFRRIALAFPGAEEGSHMGHADFRVMPGMTGV